MSPPKRKSFLARLKERRMKDDDTDGDLSGTGGRSEEIGREGSLYYDINSPHDFYQYPARETSTFIKHHVVSWTDSKESHQRIAKRYRNILRWNNRIPTTEIRLHFNKFTVKEINEFLAKIRRTLQRNTKKRKGLRYIAFTEVTTKRKKPISKVHFHFLTDDERSENELRQFFTMACERAGMVENKDFQIKRIRPLPKGKNYFDYVLKYGKNHQDKAILFRKFRRAKKGEGKKKGRRIATRIQKIFQSEWYKKPIKQIRKEIREWKKRRDEAKARGEDVRGMRFCMEE